MIVLKETACSMCLSPIVFIQTLFLHLTVSLSI